MWENQTLPSHRIPKLHCICDQGFPRHAGEYLTRNGHNVSYASDIPAWKQRSVADTTVLKRATREKRVLLVTDKDFKAYTFSRELTERSYGIAVFQTSLYTRDQFVKIADKLRANASMRRLRGRICLVSVEQISYRAP